LSGSIKSPATSIGGVLVSVPAAPERLRQIVVGAQLQPDHAIDLLSARREHQDRRVVASLAQRAADVEAVPVRKHEVQDDEVERAGLNRVHGVTHGRGDGDPALLFLQMHPQQPGELGLVLDDQDCTRHATVLLGCDVRIERKVKGSWEFGEISLRR
jgi:hypothetical protein